jgi:putative solute:sodium symporter small subunit
MAEHVSVDHGPRPHRSPAEKESLRRYWRANLRIMAVLLTVWFVAGLGCGVLWADWLNQFHLPGTAFPLGFWFAQQGSIIIFVLVILVYCVLMNGLDRKHHEELVEIRRREGR